MTTEAVLLEWLNALSDVSTRRIAAESDLRSEGTLAFAADPGYGDWMPLWY